MPKKTAEEIEEFVRLALNRLEGAYPEFPGLPATEGGLVDFGMASALRHVLRFILGTDEINVHSRTELSIDA